MSNTVPDALRPMTDDEVFSSVAQLLALIDGLPTSRHHCGTCGREYRLNVSFMLEALSIELRRELLRRAVQVPDAFLSRWAALEVD